MVSMVYGLSAFLITYLYIYWYSNNKRIKAQSITNGKMLPEIIVQDIQNNQVDSKTLLGKKAVIFFYRGNWCPLCMAQIDEIAASYKKFAEKNINVVFIAPQSSKNTQKLANKFNLDFKFYTDKNNLSAKKLGIAHAYGLPMGFQVLGYDSDSVYPTIIAIDENGIIIYNDQTDNYRVRPEPEDLLKIFDK
jgi:peroxiredoxin